MSRLTIAALAVALIAIPSLLSGSERAAETTQQRIDNANAIIIGTVTAVRDNHMSLTIHALGDEPRPAMTTRYSIATIEIDQILKPAPGVPDLDDRVAGRLLPRHRVDHPDDGGPRRTGARPAQGATGQARPADPRLMCSVGLCGAPHNSTSWATSPPASSGLSCCST